MNDENAMQPRVIVTFPKGQLGSRDKDRLTRHGIIWLEAENPDSIKQLVLTQPMVQTVITGDAIICAALKTIANCYPDSTAKLFVKYLYSTVKDEQNN